MTNLSIKIGLLLLVISTLANAEFLLYKKTDGEKPYSININSYAEETVQNQQDIRDIFYTILMKYQWPMISTYFNELSDQEKDDFIAALRKPHGLKNYIQDKLDKKYGPDVYEIRFVPVTFFELAAITSFMMDIIESNATPFKGSIFPGDDIRNSEFVTKKFADTFAGTLIRGLKETQGKVNADLSALEKVAELFNNSDSSFDMFLKTSAYLDSIFVEKSLGKSICNALKDNGDDLVKHTIKKSSELEKKYDNALAKKENNLWAIKNQNDKKRIAYIPEESTPFFQKAIELECQADEKNQFLLYRGTGGFVVNGDDHTTIIDSPYRESDLDYAKLKKAKYQPLLELSPPFAISFKNEEQRDEFTPYSLAYGNSLLAGTFHEASLGIGGSSGARALDYVQRNRGYALIFPIKDFLVTNEVPSLRQKYMISSLYPLIALFAKGEYFHSRSKVSLFHPLKNLKAIGGFFGASSIKGYEPDESPSKKLFIEDRLYKSGFIITPGMNWTKLHSNISRDIAENMEWINPPRDATQWLLAQTDFAKFSSLVERFEQEYKPQLIEIKKEETNKPSYDKSNVFFKILQDISNLTTKAFVNSEYSLSFEDKMKRTKEHALVIPKGQYVSFSHFSDLAKPDEFKDLLMTIAKTAKKLKVAHTGYRIITNHSINPGALKNNDANQEIGHFHFHIAGGECLGKTVAAREHGMEISPLPFASDLTKEEMIQYAHAHALSEKRFVDEDGKDRLFIAYNVEQKDSNIKHLVGFLVLNENERSPYINIEDFAKKASGKEIMQLFQLINDVAHALGIYETGYRVISSLGNDAGEYPKDIFQMFLAGGNALGTTVTNMYGNQKGNESRTLDFKDLMEYPHEHCKTNAYDNYEFYLTLVKNPPFVKENSQELISLNYSYSDMDLSHMPEDILEPEKVGELQLSYNNLSVVPDWVKKLTNLRKLHIDNNDMSALPTWFSELQDLRVLNISNNHFSDLPDEIGKLSNMDTIIASNNSISSIQVLSELHRLKILIINNNNLTKVPDWIEHLTNLKTLDCANNKITEFPHGLENLPELERLDLRNNDLAMLPESIVDIILTKPAFRALRLGNNAKIMEAANDLKKKYPRKVF